MRYTVSNIEVRKGKRLPKGIQAVFRYHNKSVQASPLGVIPRGVKVTRVFLGSQLAHLYVMDPGCAVQQHS